MGVKTVHVPEVKQLKGYLENTLGINQDFAPHLRKAIENLGDVLEKTDADFMKRAKDALATVGEAGEFFKQPENKERIKKIMAFIDKAMADEKLLENVKDLLEYVNGFLKTVDGAVGLINSEFIASVKNALDKIDILRNNNSCYNLA